VESVDVESASDPVEEEPRRLDEVMVEASPDNVLCRLDRPPLKPGEEEVVDKVVRVLEESVVGEVDVAVEEGEVLGGLVVGMEVVTVSEVAPKPPLVVVVVEDTEVETAGRRAVVPVLLPLDESVGPAGTKARSCGGLSSLFKDNDRRA